MKNISRLLLTLLVAISATTFAANVATVNGVGISQDQFNQALERATRSGAADSPQLRDALKRQLIVNELLYQEANKQKLGTTPEVTRTVDAVRRQAMVDTYIAKNVKPQPVTDAAVRSEYDNFKARLGPQEYRLRLIQTATEANAQESLRQIKQGQDFAQVAQRTSALPNATQGGAINWISFKTPVDSNATNLPIPVALAQAIEKLKPGEVSPVISSNNAFWIVKLEESRATKVPAFDDVKDEIRNALTARSLDAALGAKIETLSKQAKIQMQ